MEEWQQRWPGVVIDEEMFRTALLAAKVPPQFAPDYYLATACAAGNRPAQAHFEREFISQVDKSVKHLRLDDAKLDDLRGALRDRMLPPPAGCLNKIASYRGEGPLAAWVRVAAVRLAIRTHQLPGIVQPTPVALPDPTRHLERARYQAMFEAYLREGVALLDLRERTLLRMYYEDELSLTTIGRMLHLHKSNVWRQLETAKDRIQSYCRHKLQTELALSADDCAGVIDVLLSQLEVSLSGLGIPAVQSVKA